MLIMITVVIFRDGKGTHIRLGTVATSITAILFTDSERTYKWLVTILGGKNNPVISKIAERTYIMLVIMITALIPIP